MLESKNREDLIGATRTVLLKGLLVLRDHFNGMSEILAFDSFEEVDLLIQKLKADFGKEMAKKRFEIIKLPTTKITIDDFADAPSHFGMDLIDDCQKISLDGSEDLVCFAGPKDPVSLKC